VKKPTLLVTILTSGILVSCAFAQQKSSPDKSAETASPEMQRLAKLFVGEWDTTETMERSEFFADGGRRKGISHWRLGVGGTTLIGDGFSDGSVGPLDHLIIIWWDNKAKVYGYFVCFKDTGSSCMERGTAHWEGENFVNDYEETEHGQKVKWRDSFIDMTPTSHTLIAASQQNDGTMKTLITTRSTRR
jgi:hypothetical protein